MSIIGNSDMVGELYMVHKNDMSFFCNNDMVGELYMQFRYVEFPFL